MEEIIILENMPSIYDMSVPIPTENGIENVPSSEIYTEKYVEKNLVNYNSFSTQVSSFYNDIEFEKRKNVRDSYMIDLSKRSNTLRSKSVIIQNQTNVQNGMSQVSNIFLKTGVRFSYPSFTRTSDFQSNGVLNITSDVRFVYPSVK